MATVRLLHTNDLHGALDDAREGALARLRAEVDLYFDSGDAIRAGNLAAPLRPEAVWPRLERLGVAAGVLGNRETHLLEAAFRAKLAGARHPILAANLRGRNGARPLPGELRLSANGLSVGVFGVSVPMVTERMAARFASAYLWDPPVATAVEIARRLRPQVDLLIGLTHIGMRQDLALAAAAPEIDVLLAGHSHTVLHEPRRENGVWICQGGSHARFAGVYSWTDGVLEGGLRSLETQTGGPGDEPDPPARRGAPT